MTPASTPGESRAIPPPASFKLAGEPKANGAAAVHGENPNLASSPASNPAFGATPGTGPIHTAAQSSAAADGNREPSLVAPKAMPAAISPASAGEAPASPNGRGIASPGLEVGYRDPELGYVELRAHIDGSGVHASLAAHSDSSQALLAGNLSELASWMNQRHTPVQTLTVLNFTEMAQGKDSTTWSEGGASEGSSPGAQQEGKGPPAASPSGPTSRPESLPASWTGSGLPAGAAALGSWGSDSVHGHQISVVA